MSISIKLIRKEFVEELQRAIQQKETAIEKASHFIKEIEKGNLDIDFSIDEQASPDETNTLQESLVSMRNQLKKISQDEKERNWATEGLAKFADILRQDNNDLKALADCVLSNLVKYLNANQGALFMLNDEDHHDAHLEMMACYAYDRKKYMKRRISFGEGLAGQSFLEKEAIYMTKVPDHYVSIGSGLGDARPSVLLIVPLKINNEVFGVVELASFREIKPYQQEFVARLGESIASTISSARIANRTKVLLEESQQQAEEMRAQEEEVRQNMEELTATQEEMSRLLNETKVQEQFMVDLLDASPDTIFIVDQHINLQLFNKAFVQLCEAQGINPRKGNSLSVIYKDSDEWKENEKLCRRALSGEEFELMITKEIGGRENVFNVNYIPIRGNEGEVRSVAIFAKSVTEIELARRENEALLQESQQRNAEMKAQEDMLKQNMEEISAIQEDVQNKMKELESRMQAINNSGFASIEFDLQANVLEANQNFCDLMGYSLEEIQGQHHRMFVTQEVGKSKEYQDFLQNLSQGKSYSGEFTRIRKDGTTVHINGSYSPILDENGEPVRIIKLATDITEAKESYQQAQAQTESLEKQAQELQKNAGKFETMQQELSQTVTEMQYNEHLLSQTIDASEASIVVIDRQYDIVSFNSRFKEDLRHSGTKCQRGMSLLETLSPEERESSVAMWEKVLEGERQEFVLSLSGQHLKVCLSPFVGMDDNIVGIISHSEDITELHELRQMREQARQKK